MEHVLTLHTTSNLPSCTHRCARTDFRLHKLLVWESFLWNPAGLRTHGLSATLNDDAANVSQPTICPRSPHAASSTHATQVPPPHDKP